jgi:hypothetical protein
MPRPSNKKDLVLADIEKYKELNHLISELNELELESPYDFSSYENKKEAHWSRDKNLRDVLIHLNEWHKLLITWIESNQKGCNTSFLPSPYNWKNIADMNQLFFQKHQNTSLTEAEENLNESHIRILNLIESLTNEELFEKKYFDWTGTTSLGSYCISATSSHYDWAIKKIKVHRKRCKNL